MKYRRRSPGPELRSGYIYVFTILASLLIFTLGLGSLQLLRLQGKRAGNGNDFIEARLYARSAIDIGMLKIRQDAFWRTNLGNGVWISNQPIGSGNFSLFAVDPVDNDVTTGDNDPIILTATGIMRNAQFKESVRLEVGPPVGSALEVSMTSGADTNVNNAKLTGNQTVCANGQYNADKATVNANVEAVNGINGSTYAKAQTTRSTTRSLPDPVHVFDYYMAGGATIQYSDLPVWGNDQMLANTSFETGIQNWYAVGSKTAIQQSILQHRDGNYSLLVSNRQLSTDAVAQTLIPASMTLMASGNTYNITLPLYCGTACTASVVLTLTDSTNTTQVLTGTITNVSAKWTNVQATFTPTWSGSLTQATVSVSVSSPTASFYIDKLTMTDMTFDNTFSNGLYVMDRAVLSPASNPYGANQTNAGGIYIVNCAGQDVAIGRMRIVGTLVLVNPGGNSVVQGPLVWEAAIPNYPALMVNNSGGVFAITMGSAAFSEAPLGVNFNPVGTPYPYVGGAANTTLTDTYPSQITGIVYSNLELDFSGAPTITGVVISGNNIGVNATSLNLNYNNIYLNNPPPGFTCGILTMKTVPGTWRRVVP